jgi:hypothetical protein
MLALLEVCHPELQGREPETDRLSLSITQAGKR